MKRPMIYWISLFILGEIISLQLSLVMIMMCLLGVSVFILGAPYFFKKNKWLIRNKRIWFLGIVFMFLGVLDMYCLSKDIQMLNSTECKTITFGGKITDIEQKTLHTYYTVKLNQMLIDGNGYPIHRKIRVEFASTDDRWLPGDYIQGEGTGQRFSKATNPGGYDEEVFMFGNGEFFSIMDVSVTYYKRSKFSLIQTIYQTRECLKQIYAACLPEKDASLAGAMVLGDKAGLDKDVKELYQQNGIAHLIAISGLHIAMIGGTLYQLLRKCIGGYVFPVSISIGLIVLYGMMTGLSGATCRAVIMIILSLLSQLLGRKYDILSAVSLSLLLMLMKNPFQITQAGFLLSYGAILAIAIINPVWKKLFPKLPRWLEGFFVSLSVQLGTLPVMLSFFYEISVYSVIMNVIVVPVMSVLLFFLLCSGLLGLFSMEFAKVPAFFVQIIFRFYEALCEMNGQLPGTTFCMGKPEPWWIITYYACLIIFLLLGYYGRKQYHAIKIMKNKRKASFVTVGIVILFVSVLTIPIVSKSDLLICMFDVGQGDGIYIRTPHHYHLLMDGGSSSKKNIGQYVLEKGLNYYGCNELDYVFITHSDTDHYSGIKELLEKDRMRIHNLILPGIANPDSSYKELENLAYEKNCNVYHMCKGNSLWLDGVLFQCLNPENISYENKNTGSLVFLLQYQQFDMLFTGDMEQSVEEALLNQKQDWFIDKVKGDFEVLKVAHHGSDTASSKEFLELLKPQFALISVGENNRYHHPCTTVLENLKKVNAKIMRTDNHGGIVISVKEKNHYVVKQKNSWYDNKQDRS